MVPSLFLAHGSPMLAIEDTEYAYFLEKLGQRFAPKAIVIFSAHWESDVTTISYSDEVYETIYDFGGFPEELYKIKYAAKGSREVADKVRERMQQHGLSVKFNMTRGLDHGSWTLLYRMYKEANIPVVQVSVNPFSPASEQYKIGESLRGLGREDILVIGSGVTVHNLRTVNWHSSNVEPWAVEFDDWLIDKIEKQKIDELFQWEKKAPHARLAVPRPEHFVPFFIALGSGDDLASAKIIHRSYDLGTLSYLCYQF